MVGRPVLLALGLAGSFSPASAWTQPADPVPAAARSKGLDLGGAGFTLNAGGSEPVAASQIAALFQPGATVRPSPRPLGLAAIGRPEAAPATFDVLVGGVAPLPAEFATLPARPARPVADDAPPALAMMVSILPPPRPAGPATPAIAAFEAAALPPARPAFDRHPEPRRTASLPETSEPPGDLLAAPLPPVTEMVPLPAGGHGGLDDRIAYHARLNEVPTDLVHRVVVRESKYNPKAVGRGGALGLMQIKHATARALGYGGPAKGLLDAETNLTYAVKYLAGAYRTASGNYDRAVSYYARGYYYAAKRLAADETASGSRGVLRGRASRSDVLAAATNVETGQTAEMR